jgi:hypothetical protein
MQTLIASRRRIKGPITWPGRLHAASATDSPEAGAHIRFAVPLPFDIGRSIFLAQMSGAREKRQIREKRANVKISAVFEVFRGPT